MAKNYHVVKKGSGWSVKRAGKTLSSHRTQKTAITNAVIKAKIRQTEVIVHGRDGTKDSYGNDPNPPRDERTLNK